MAILTSVGLNMENKTLQEVAKELIDFPGKTKGEVFHTHAEYIKHKEGEEGLKRVEDKMAELGAPIRFNEVKPFQWIGEGVSSLTIIVAKEVFNWTDEDVFEMGRFAPKVSFIIRVLIQFSSTEKVFKEASKYWKRHFDFGSLEPVEFNEEDGYILMRADVGNLKTHPLICIFLGGYFKGIAGLIVKSDKINVKEVSCVHRGDAYHDYLITWK